MNRRLLAIALALLMLPGCQDSGDRVLVAKFLYDSDITPPSRYDVVVFKFPELPVEKGSPKNYIKRLLGLPGELIAIFLGRIYRFRHDAPSPPPGLGQEEWRSLTDTHRQCDHTDYLASVGVGAEEWNKLEPASKLSKLDLWKFPPKNHPAAKKLWQETKQAEMHGKKGTFEVLRKPPRVMLALSRPVYDNDHPAKDLKGVLPDRWAPQGSAPWLADNNRGFAISGAGNWESWLRYRHVLRPGDWPEKNNIQAEGRIQEIKERANMPQLITDFLGYNTYANQGNFAAANWVGDLMLSCKLTVDEPKGEFWLELSRGVDRFQARFNLTTGVCTLHRRTTSYADDGSRTVSDWQLLASADTRVKAKGEYVLRLANFDDRLTVWVGRDLPFDDGKEYSPATEVGPDRTAVNPKEGLDAIMNNDLQPAGLCSVGASVQVHNLQVWRDTYYTGFDQRMMVPADQSAVKADDWGHPDTWDPIRKLEPSTIFVFPGHYLCLGDNSQESSDSRHWGLVPQRLMLGRALMVYFPFGRAGTIK